MDAIMQVLQVQIQAMSAKLDSVVGSLEELKAENRVLKDGLKELKQELCGVRASSDETDECVDLAEMKTVRGILEEIAFDIHGAKGWRPTKGNVHGAKTNCPSFFHEVLANPDDCLEELAEEYPVVEITHPTSTEEDEWVKLKMSEVRKQVGPLLIQGESIWGIQAIGTETASSVASESEEELEHLQATCLVHISNYTMYTLKDSEAYSFTASKMFGPIKVIGRTKEAYSSLQDEGNCRFLHSFSIGTTDFRLVITCFVNCLDGNIFLGLGFIPSSLAVDERLSNYRVAEVSLPDFCFRTWEDSSAAQEIIVHQGNVVARAYMTHGPKSWVELEIMEMQMNREDEKLSRDNLPAFATLQSRNLLPSANYVSALSKIACIVDIRNTLMVSLENPVWYIGSCDSHSFLPTEIISSTQEVFFASDNEKVEAAFIYAIKSTDLGLRVAFRIEAERKLFVCEFVPREAELTGQDVMDLLDLTKRIHGLQHRHSKTMTGNGDLVLETRNIRATVRLSGEETFLLQIRVSAF